jgi:hypothetical protein
VSADSLEVVNQLKNKGICYKIEEQSCQKPQLRLKLTALLLSLVFQPAS